MNKKKSKVNLEQPTKSVTLIMRSEQPQEKQIKNNYKA